MRDLYVFLGGLRDFQGYMFVLGRFDNRFFVLGYDENICYRYE